MLLRLGARGAWGAWQLKRNPDALLANFAGDASGVFRHSLGKFQDVAERRV